MRFYTPILFFAFIGLLIGGAFVSREIFSWKGPLQQHISYKSSSPDHFFSPQELSSGNIWLKKNDISNLDVIHHLLNAKNHNDFAPTLFADLLIIFSGILGFMLWFLLINKRYIAVSVLNTVIIFILTLSIFSLYMGSADCTKGRTYDCFEQIPFLIGLTTYTILFTVFSIFLQRFLFQNIFEEHNHWITLIKKMFTKYIIFLILLIIIAPITILLITN